MPTEDSQPQIESQKRPTWHEKNVFRNWKILPRNLLNTDRFKRQGQTDAKKGNRNVLLRQDIELHQHSSDK